MLDLLLFSHKYFKFYEKSQMSLSVVFTIALLLHTRHLHSNTVLFNVIFPMLSSQVQRLSYEIVICLVCSLEGTGTFPSLDY